VSWALPGFSSADGKGNWTGLCVDVCRAIAAAVLSDPTKVLFVPLSAKERFTALQSGEIDLLSQNSNWSLTRDASLGLNDAGVTYYDGQEFMVRKTSKIHSPLEFDTASICVHTGTTNERNVADYFRANDLRYEIIAFTTADEALKTYGKGRCGTYTSDASQLYSDRLKLADPSERVVLQKIISKEPLGPAVRRGDDQWHDIVKWTLFAMLDAEELGVTQKTIDQIVESDQPGDLPQMRPK
jgi:general L-amino acid transport system substrate-binding protein